MRLKQSQPYIAAHYATRKAWKEVILPHLETLRHQRKERKEASCQKNITFAAVKMTGDCNVRYTLQESASKRDQLAKYKRQASGSFFIYKGVPLSMLCLQK